MIGEYDAGYEHYIDSMVKQMEDMQYRIDCLHRDNAKLLERIDAAHMSRLLTENENESLRELCADMLHDAMENICSKAHWCDEKSWQTCNDEKCGNRLYVETARELGVEVDG